MSAISTLVLIQLDGDLPPALNLTPLRTLSASCRSVSVTLSPFLRENASVVPVNRREDFATIPSTSGLVAIYVVGHAWMDDQQFRTSIRSREGSHLLTGHEFAEMLLASPLSGATELILLVDTCNAAGLINEIKTLRRSTNTCVIAASSEGQSTLEYPLDRTTRFAAALKASI